MDIFDNSIFAYFLDVHKNQQKNWSLGIRIVFILTKQQEAINIEYLKKSLIG